LKKETPLGIAKFDIERSYFIAAVNKLLSDPDLSKTDIGLEIDGTIAVLRHLAALEAIPLGG
jgi:hypothetical protein